MQIFSDRYDAGQQLAEALEGYRDQPDVIVLALPRGGVPVGYEVAKALHVPLDVLVVRKLGVPGHRELAMGAIASGGILIVDRHVKAVMQVSDEAFEAVVEQERIELDRREHAFRNNRPITDVRGKIAIIVDDGLATGSTMTAAIDAVGSRNPTKLVVAIPVAPPQVCEVLRERVDDMVCLAMPERMHAVGLCYEDFSQTTDVEVRELLDEAARALRVHANPNTEHAPA